MTNCESCIIDAVCYVKKQALGPGMYSHDPIMIQIDVSIHSYVPAYNELVVIAL